MPQVTIAPDAEHDLIQIGLYIARDNPGRAIAFVDEITDTFEELAHQPRMGRDRVDVLPNLRGFSHGDYLIFYRIVEQGIEVARVIHGARDISAMFKR